MGGLRRALLGRRLRALLGARLIYPKYRHHPAASRKQADFVCFHRLEGCKRVQVASDHFRNGSVEFRPNTLHTLRLALVFGVHGWHICSWFNRLHT